jgi:hypothetical protein
LADKALRPMAARQLPDPRDLIVDCAQEMDHLADLLPALYGRFGDGWRQRCAIQGEQSSLDAKAFE